MVGGALVIFIGVTDYWIGDYLRGAAMTSFGTLCIIVGVIMSVLKV